MKLRKKQLLELGGSGIFLTILIVVAGVVLYWAWPQAALDPEKEIMVHFLGINQADSIIVQTKNHNILIDTGLDTDWPVLQAKLNALDIEMIDYLILTHPDKDHIGGAAQVLRNFTVKNILQTGFDKQSELQAQLNQVIAESTVNNMIVTQNYQFSADGLIFNIYPVQTEAMRAQLQANADSNNSSLVTTIQYDQIGFWLGGDIGGVRIPEVLGLNLPSYTVMKVPYHGRYDALSPQLIQAVQPQYAVATTKRLEQPMMGALSAVGAKVFLTANNGVTFRSDGQKLQVQ